jgi:hypothetical protein
MGADDDVFRQPAPERSGETTRPARAAALKAFESSYLDSLDKAIQARTLKSSKWHSKRASKGAMDVTSARVSRTSNTSFRRPLLPRSRISREPVSAYGNGGWRRRAAARTGAGR